MNKQEQLTGFEYEECEINTIYKCLDYCWDHSEDEDDRRVIANILKKIDKTKNIII